MEKTRRMLYLPLAFHAAVLLAMTVMFFMKMKTGAFGILVMADLAGVLVSPMFMALMGICHAILHEGKVFDYLRESVVYLVIIGLLRMAVYAVQYIDSFVMTLTMAAVAIGIYFLWASIFSFTDKLMKQKTKPWNRRKRK